MIMLPLVPMLLEWLAKGDISFQTATISAAIFASSNGITSRRDFIMYLCILIAMVMCFLFGAGILGKELVHKSVPFLSIFFVAFTIVVERYTLHVVELKPFRN